MRLQFFGALALVSLAGSISGVSAQNAALPKPTNPPVKGKITLPHWVGPLKGNPIDDACYRKTHLAHKKQCTPGYEFDKLTTCWAQCPLEYPVACGMECLPQNQDCTKEIIKKVASVVNVALNAATVGVFGELTKAAKGVQQGVKCGQQLYNVVTKIMGYIDEVETGGKVDTTKQQLVFLLSKSDFALTDLPVAVATCLGLPAPTGLEPVKQIMDVVNKILDELVNKKKSGQDVLQTDNFLNFTSSVGAGGSLSSLKPEEKEFLKKLVDGGVTCGSKIKDVVDQAVKSIQELKQNNPKTAVDAIRFAVLNSKLLLKDLPDATIGCFDENAPDGFKNRDEIIKTVHVIIDRVIEAASQNGNPVSKADYAIVIANLGLDAIALFDPTGLAAMAKEFVQPICGPTVFIGDIDDGPADQALGLTTMQKAFRNTTGQWLQKGDGKLTLTFKSVDTLDVKVNVLSGGKLAYEVPVKKGETLVWTKPLSEFQGKTLYLDRWRAGFFGIPGSGGGSVLAWVPMDADGSLKLTVPINPTSFSDHDRLLRA